MQQSAFLSAVTPEPEKTPVFDSAAAQDSRHVLLLQGPIGPFFSRFSEDLEQRGFTVTKINFNGGDRFFYRRRGAIDYTGKLDDWESWLERLVANRQITRLYLFGDCRAYHRIACEVARRNRIRVFVFEEGYIRPNFITLEEGGVNGRSRMLYEPLNIGNIPKELPAENQQPKKVFLLTAVYSMIYYWASAARKDRFEHYRHHRPFEWFSEGTRWIRSGLRKLMYARRERHVLETVLSEFENNYFVCPLQVHCDMQVVVHSEFNSIEHFIGEVLASFRQHAPSNKAIVFKHHPMDRGYTDYTMLFANLVAELGLQGRVFYVHDVCLPTLLRSAQGTVLINSTVGMSSLFHGTPVKAMGKAVYDIPGLTVQLSLDDFWNKNMSVDNDYFQAFRAFLIMRNQLNGNLYRRISKEGSTGIVWSANLDDQHRWQDSDRSAQSGPRLTVIEGGVAAKRQIQRDDDSAAAA